MAIAGADRLPLRRDVEVPGEQDLLLRQKRDQHAVAVLEVLDVVQLDGVRVVLEDALVARRLDLGLPVRLGEVVADERARIAQPLFQKALVVRVGDDRDPFGGKRREAAGVIEVRVRVDDVPDRLVRNHLLGFGDDRDAARFALPAFEHDDVILELDRQRDVAAGDPVDAFGHLL